MSSAGWLAIGAVVAAVAAPGAGARAVAWLAGVVALAVGRLPRGRRPAIAAAIGAVAVAVRVASALGPLPAPGPATEVPLPDGAGPWHGVVETRGSNRAGEQPAVVRLEGPGSRLVAVSLPRYPDIEPGQRISFSGELEAPPEGPYGDYLARIGVAATTRSRTLTVEGVIDGPGAALERLRRGAGDALAAAIPEPEAGLAAGIVVGLRDRVDRDLAAAFTTVGASHVVAISGWNIAIVGATVAALAGGLGRRRRSAILVGAIIAYVLFAGASASVVRAAAMAGVVLLARETGRAGRAAAALGWAATILLVVEPSLVGDAGFQLSSLATAGILAWADPLEGRLRRLRGGRVPGWLAESLAVSLAAQAATLPIVLATFGRLALIAPATNLLIVPVVAPAMAAAGVALLGGAVAVLGGPTLVATIAGLPAWVLLTAMCTIVRVSAAVPFASVGLDPPWSTVAGIAVVVLPPLAWRVRRARRSSSEAAVAAPPTSEPAPSSAGRRPPAARAIPSRLALVALAVAVGALGLAAAHRPTGETRITVLDVGQGDAILVEGGAGGRMLVDGGPDPDRLIVELDRRLPPWDRRIDLLVLTHPHEDHVAGLPILLDRYRIGRVYETGMRGPGPGYAAFARELASRGAPPLGTLQTGSRIALDDIAFRVLWPDPGRVPREPPDGGRGINDVSIVLLGEVAGRRFLLTGDVEDDVDPILASRGIPPVDILKVAHHGSGTASTPAFVGEVRPRVAIVSAGAGNPYGHPAKSTIDRLRDAGARVLRTDTDGSVAVTIETDGTIAVAASGARRAVVAPVGGAVVAGGASSIAAASTTFRCGIPSSG
jgi:competence protein ComEC